VIDIGHETTDQEFLDRLISTLKDKEGSNAPNVTVSEIVDVVNNHNFSPLLQFLSLMNTSMNRKVSVVWIILINVLSLIFHVPVGGQWPSLD
jgi:hypothetical protein